MAFALPWRDYRDRDERKMRTDQMGMSIISRL